MREKERKTIIHSGGNGRGEARGNGGWLSSSCRLKPRSSPPPAAQGAAIGAFMGTLIHYACYLYVHMIFFHRVYNFINNNKNK